MMASAAQMTLSNSTRIVLDAFLPHKDTPDDGTIEIDGAHVKHLIRVLRSMHHLAILMERENGALRSLCGDSLPSQTINRAVTDATRDIVSDPEGKIIRPNFGGKKNDGEA